MATIIDPEKATERVENRSGGAKTVTVGGVTYPLGGRDMEGAWSPAAVRPEGVEEQVWDAFFTAMALDTDRIRPPLSDYAVSREGIYEDRP